jgi:hypothetical protein
MFAAQRCAVQDAWCCKVPVQTATCGAAYATVHLALQHGLAQLDQ